MTHLPMCSRDADECHPLCTHLIDPEIPAEPMTAAPPTDNPTNSTTALRKDEQL